MTGYETTNGSTTGIWEFGSLSPKLPKLPKLPRNSETPRNSGSLSPKLPQTPPVVSPRIVRVAGTAMISLRRPMTSFA